MKVIDYLFFKFYKLWQHSSISEISTYAAILFLSIFLNCNIHTVWGILELYKLAIHPTRLVYNISLCVIFLLLCFYLGWHKRYKIIIENYEKHLHSGNILVIIIYMFLSLLLYVLLSFWKKSII